MHALTEFQTDQAVFGL